MKTDMVILADGDFPSHPLPLETLRNVSRIIACDGAAKSLLAWGREPDWVVGDLDSLDLDFRQKLASRIIHVSEQETNDLSKAFRFAMQQIGKEEYLTILGATGKREDHTLGNLSLLADYATIHPNIRMLTDTGIFFPAVQSGSYPSRPGQSISIFNPSGKPVRLTADGLKYPIRDLELSRWWTATLNTALENSFSLLFESDVPLLLFTAY
ncbi:MAG: thiamine diphosphokinase [Lentisphaeria bacterium]|nr:thiamine diphosphokinase [Lentisphaeria bacterium]